MRDKKEQVVAYKKRIRKLTKNGMSSVLLTIIGDKMLARRIPAGFAETFKTRH